MKRIRITAWLAAFSLALAGAGAREARARATGSVNILLGAKALDKEDWQPFENQGEVGLQMSFGERQWPVLIAVDLIGSRDTNPAIVSGGKTISLAGSTSEVNLGVRKEWGRRKFHPYIGGGFTIVTAKIEFVGPNEVVLSESHGGAGAWVGGGAYWRVGTRVNFGVSLRATAADVDVNALSSVRSGGGHAALLIGYGWPPRRH